ncbi:MAG: trypsin-like peptidase domain-containing protein [Eubacteriales bacterium]|nr:trypsin-like peptidase domain-containing protein [Eubacteriales bacterium]
MKKRSGLMFGLLAVLVAVAMIGCTLMNAGAANVISEDEIKGIVGTSTDSSQVSSPFTEVANKVRNSVVGVNNYTTTTAYYGYGYGFGFGYGNRQSEERESLSGTGSGVVISNYGHVLTNYHVVEGASRLTVTIANDESEHEAKVVGYDADLDIAILQVDNLNLPAVELGDSDQLQVGEWAIVIGNPLGEEFARTLTVGVVSALDREVTDTTLDRYGRRTSITNTMIQVDAAINSGNSGGGMFNVLGQLQGIPARKYSSSGYSTTTVDNIGMCIPINVAKPLIEQVLRDYDGTPVTSASSADNSSATENISSPLHGKPRLGVTVTTITSAAQSKLPMGAFVKAVDEGSPAAEGGIQKGDIIVEVDGTVVSTQTALTNKLKDYQEGDQIQVKVFRDEGLAAQADQSSIDLSQIGDGQYVDLTITLRVIDNQNM